MSGSRILYICRVGERGGGEVLLRNLLRAHDRRRFDPVVVFLENGPFVEEMKAAGFDLHLVEAGRFRDVAKTARVIAALVRIIREERIDVVASHLALAHLYGGVAAVRTGRTAVWFTYGLPEGRLPLDWFACKLPARAIFTCSRVVAESLRSFLSGRHRGKVRLFPMGVDLSRLDPSLDGRKVREEVGIDAGAPVVGLVSRFQRWKGQDYFLRAAALLWRERRDARFLIVGDTQFGLEPEYKGELEVLTRGLGLKDSTHFLGFREDLAECLAAMDVVVHGYVSKQPGGLGILDAMAMGKPVVATDSGDRLEWMVPGETGLLVRAKDPQDMAAGILTLLADSARARQMGAAGRKRVEEHFTVEKMVEAVERHYAELLT